MTNNFLTDVLNGLSRCDKCLDSKYFYDSKGSDLFNQITHVDEYYLTVAETWILNNCGSKIAAHVGNLSTLIDYGCGSLGKVKVLLEHLRQVTMLIPIDISEQGVQQAKLNVTSIYPEIEVVPLVADFTQKIDIEFILSKRGSVMAFFPGSTIGNFHPDEAKNFMHDVREVVGDKGFLLIGVDLKKDSQKLNAAYNDNNGITASFNKNILVRINNELNANFNLDAFEHYAFYNEEEGRVEMHLRSTEFQKVSLDGIEILFEKNETIHTENSYKYSVSEFQNIAQIAGFDIVDFWVDNQNLFAVHLLKS